MSEQKNKDIGALWVNEGAKGQYMTGNINGVKVVVFPNGFKDKPEQPDFRVYVSRPLNARDDTPGDDLPF